MVKRDLYAVLFWCQFSNWKFTVNKIQAIKKISSKIENFQEINLSGEKNQLVVQLNFTKNGLAKAKIAQRFASSVNLEMIILTQSFTSLFRLDSLSYF